MDKPVIRSALRLRLGKLYYGTKRKILWFRMRKCFARCHSPTQLPYVCFRHATPLIRRLKNTEMWLQQNKIVNLRIAVPRVDGILLEPGQVFSYWRLIGSTTRRKGYVKGMILRNGQVVPGVGGGLCQLSNLIFWMTIHTPLTVTERHRHGYDVFPDANRTQPFGSGATCFYPHGDLMIRNDTKQTWQLCVRVTGTHLEGEWRCSEPQTDRYEIEERNHEMRGEFWGGFSRHNDLYQLHYSGSGALLEEKHIVHNSAVMMYSPFLEE